MKFGEAHGRGRARTDGSGPVHAGPDGQGQGDLPGRIDNASPLVLNGLAIAGLGTDKADKAPKFLDDICISPSKNMSVPASAEVVDQLGLKKGIRIIAADLSGL